jgi:hypothetical protein
MTDTPASDLPYVRSGSSTPERVNPVISVDMAPIGAWTDRSINLGLTGEISLLFEAVEDNSIICRSVHNPNEDGNLWLNFTGGIAGPDSLGVWKIAPGAVMSVPSRDAVYISGDRDGMIVTAVEC